MSKIYFNEFDDEHCSDIEWHLGYMKDDSLKEMILIEAERETGTGYFYCKEYGEVGEVGESCGTDCEKYKPNNGKNGRCKHYGYCYSPTEKKFILKSNGKLIKL